MDLRSVMLLRPVDSQPVYLDANGRISRNRQGAIAVYRSNVPLPGWYHVLPAEDVSCRA